MTKEVLVSISGAHVFDGGSNDVAVIAAGTYYNKNGKHYVVYEEMVEGFAGPIKNTLKISRDSVDIIKNGSANAHMVFEKNKKNISCYATPVGQMAIGINTNQIKLEESEDQLRVIVGYSLDINYEPVSECNIVVDVQSKAVADFHLAN